MAAAAALHARSTLRLTEIAGLDDDGREKKVEKLNRFYCFW